MSRTFLAAAAALLVAGLAGCAPSQSPASTDTAGSRPASAPVAAAPPAATAPPACADRDFAAFLARFEQGADTQRAATADPLTMVSIDPDAQPEPAPVTRQVPLADVPFHVMASAAQRQAEGSEMTTIEKGPDAREVTLRLPDSGAQVRFGFRADPCWKLVRVDDDSM